VSERMQSNDRLENKFDRQGKFGSSNFDGLDQRQLERLATRMLRFNGFDRYGRRDADSSQKSFEYRMWTGAYGRNSERRRK
jgi:hypothetical protein